MKGSPLHLDESGDQFKNRIATDRAATWRGLGARQGVFAGGAAGPSSTEFGVEVEPFDGLVQTIVGGTPVQQGYYVWNDQYETVLFDAPSAEPRIDALVCAVRDPGIGTIPGGTVAGAQWVVVKGTPSATPVKPTDTDIDTAVGPGGWFRWTHVQVNPGDAQIQTGAFSDSTPILSTPRVLLRRTTDLPLGGIQTAIPWQTTDYNVHNGTPMWTSGTQIVIQEAGNYSIALSCQFTGDGTRPFNAATITVNGFAVVQSGGDAPVTNEGNARSCSIGMWLDEGDVVEGYAYCGLSGVSLQPSSNTAPGGGVTLMTVSKRS